MAVVSRPPKSNGPDRVELAGDLGGERVLDQGEDLPGVGDDVRVGQVTSRSSIPLSPTMRRPASNDAVRT